ncbi:hypothetical protein OpiT1DRAFT_04897 [Opitutaceae bacterium TAV1]|nr:hypothetical protein OpiT1DRAFT_04897 [Opitutaceae bacterium TAV1]
MNGSPAVAAATRRARQGASGGGDAAAPGSFRLVVHSADEAVRTIRREIGADARVLSVRSLPGSGWGRFFGRPQLEVIGEVKRPEIDGMPASGAALLAGETPGMAIAEPAPELPPAEAAARAKEDESDRRGIFPELLRRAERALPARTAFFGLAGSGCTSALCKWIAREVLDRRKGGTVWRVTLDRPVRPSVLDVFCEALRVPLLSWRPGMPEPGDGFLQVDLPPLSIGPENEVNRKLAAWLDRERIAGRVLVLNAACAADSLRAACAAGRAAGATHLVLTHLDEVPHRGRLWECLIESELAPLFLATGPGLSGDMEENVVGALLRRPGSSAGF